MGQFDSLSEFRMALDNIVASTSRSPRKKGRTKKANRNPRPSVRVAGPPRLGFQSGGIIENPPRKRKTKRKTKRKARKNMQFVAPQVKTRSIGSSSGGKQYKDPWARVGASVGGLKKLMPGLTKEDRREITAAARARGVGALRHTLEHLGFTERDILRAHQWMETEGVLSHGTGRYARDRKTKRKAMEILMAVRQGKNNPRRRR